MKLNLAPRRRRRIERARQSRTYGPYDGFKRVLGRKRPQILTCPCTTMTRFAASRRSDMQQCMEDKLATTNVQPPGRGCSDHGQEICQVGSRVDHADAHAGRGRFRRARDICVLWSPRTVRVKGKWFASGRRTVSFAPHHYSVFLFLACALSRRCPAGPRTRPRGDCTAKKSGS